MTVYLDSTLVMRQLVGSKSPWAGWGNWEAAYASTLMRAECSDRKSTRLNSSH